MPIVSHSLEQTTQVDGSTQNILRMYDGEAREYTIGFHAPAGFDVATKVSLSIAEMNIQLAETEFETLIGAA